MNDLLLYAILVATAVGSPVFLLLTLRYDNNRHPDGIGGGFEVPWDEDEL